MKIFTFAHKRPDFIGIQVQSFRKYLKDDFEFTVFNNAAFDLRCKDYDEINRQCNLWGASVISICKDKAIVDGCESQERVGPMFKENGEYHNPNVACAYPLCWAWSRYISKETGPVCFLDSDIFLTHEVRLTDYLIDHDLCYIPQFRVGAAEYMWNAFFLADMSRLPEPSSMNWYCGQVNQVPVDVGGQTWNYLNSYPELRKLQIHSAFIPDDPSTNFHPTDYEILFLGEKQFALHYRSGSNWDGKPEVYHQKKTQWLHNILNLKGV